MLKAALTSINAGAFGRFSTRTCQRPSVSFQSEWFEHQSGPRDELTLEVKGHAKEGIKTNV